MKTEINKDTQQKSKMLFISDLHDIFKNLKRFAQIRNLGNHAVFQYNSCKIWEIEEQYAEMTANSEGNKMLFKSVQDMIERRVMRTYIQSEKF